MIGKNVYDSFDSFETSYQALLGITSWRHHFAKQTKVSSTKSEVTRKKNLNLLNMNFTYLVSQISKQVSILEAEKRD